MLFRSADGHPHDIAQIFADGGERGMAAIFHIRHQSGESRLEQALFDDLIRKRRIMDFVALPAVIGVGAVLFGVRNHLDQLDLLNDLRWFVLQGDVAAVAFRARWTVIFPVIIDFIFTEGRAFMLGVAGLATSFFLPFALFRLRWLGDIRRRRLAGIRRVLL